VSELSRRVFFGTNNPYQLEESKPGMVSATVGHHLAQVILEVRRRRHIIPLRLPR